MIVKRHGILYRFLILALACTLFLTSFVPVAAIDHIRDLENSTSDLTNELTNLNADLEQLDAEFLAISNEIAQIQTEIDAVKTELAEAKGEEQVRYEAMKLRIVYMYETGTNYYLEMLFSATSMADFLNRADFFTMISDYDRAILSELVMTQELIREKEASLLSQQERLNQLLTDLDAKEQAIRKQIDKTSAELSDYTAKLEAAREEAQKAQDSLKEEVTPVLPPKPESKPDPEPAPDETLNETPSDKDEDDEPISATASDLELFAALIECEAGSRDYEGMLAVASVVVNRMKNRYYPDTLRGVIYQSGQFPPAHDGKLDRVLKRGVKASCLQAAQDALNGKNNIGDCLSFRAASSGHSGIVIGDNVFF